MLQGVQGARKKQTPAMSIFSFFMFNCYIYVFVAFIILITVPFNKTCIGVLKYTRKIYSSYEYPLHPRIILKSCPGSLLSSVRSHLLPWLHVKIKTSLIFSPLFDERYYHRKNTFEFGDPSVYLGHFGASVEQTQWIFKPRMVGSYQA